MACILEKFMSKENSGEAIDKANFQLSHGSISNLLDIISLNRANKLKKMKAMKKLSKESKNSMKIKNSKLKEIIRNEIISLTNQRKK